MARNNFGEPLKASMINSSRSDLDPISPARKHAAIVLAGGLIMTSAVLSVPVPVYADTACPSVNPYPAEQAHSN